MTGRRYLQLYRTLNAAWLTDQVDRDVSKPIQPVQPDQDAAGNP